LSGFCQTRFKRPDELLGPVARLYQSTEHPDHIEDPRDSSLVERVDVEPAPDQIGDDVRLKIGERQDEVPLQGEDLLDVRRCEGAHPRFLTASPRRAHEIAGDADDAVLLAEQIQRLDGFFR
jgi:hypothetical protein